MSELQVKLPDARITDEMLAEVRKLIGTKFRIAHAVNNEEATRMAILKFANGIGDTNPLWTDPEYAEKTRYGMIVAPPSWVFSVFSGLQYGFRGVGGFHSASDIEFYLPILRNDRITPEMICTDIVGPKKSAFAENTVIECNDNLYTNQRGELVTKVSWEVTHFERLKARKTGKYHHIQLPHPWTEEELKKIEEEVLAEEGSGAHTPCWDDVEIGREIDPLVKGPVTMTDEIAFLIGGGAPIPRLAANIAALRFYRRHPNWAFRDPTSCALEPIYAVHYNREAARAQGLPYQYDVGYQRNSWQIHLITNWMGDEGWLKRSYCEFRRFVYYSDVVWLRGEITEKFVDDGNECCVKIKTTAINQRGEEVMPGYAIVALPSKKHGYQPLDKRLKQT
ncbi:MAG: MaoC family dehydratase N-terminal domain-containing protein [Thermodesulfobacteriota bacterium]|jgi:acyl dehydratase